MHKYATGRRLYAAPVIPNRIPTSAMVHRKQNDTVGLTLEEGTSSKPVLLYLGVGTPIKGGGSNFWGLPWVALFPFGLNGKHALWGSRVPTIVTLELPCRKSLKNTA